jgi:hypothetical protein
VVVLQTAPSGVTQDSAPKWQAALIVNALFGFPLISNLPVFLRMESRGISVGYRLAVALASLCYVFGKLRRTATYRPTLRLAIAYASIGLLALRLWWDGSVASIPLDLDWEGYWGFFVGATLIPALPFSFAVTPEGISRALSAALYVGILTAVLIVLAAIQGVTGALLTGRLSTTVLNAISVGHVGVSLGIIGFATISSMRANHTKHRITTLVAWCASLLGIGLAVASVSKGPLVALLAAFLWFGCRSILQSQISRNAVALTILVASLCAVAASYLVVNTDFLPDEGVFSRLIYSPGDASTGTRLELMSSALQQFERHPLFGDSLVESSTRFYPHNILVEALMALGALGFLTVFALCALAVIDAYRISVRADAWTWVACIFLQYFLDAMFSGSLYFSPMFWVSTLLVLQIGAQLAPETSSILPAGCARSREPSGDGR